MLNAPGEERPPPHSHPFEDTEPAAIEERTGEAIAKLGDIDPQIFCKQKLEDLNLDLPHDRRTAQLWIDWYRERGIRYPKIEAKLAAYHRNMYRSIFGRERDKVSGDEHLKMSAQGLMADWDQ
jgi:hypothetical protein